MDLLASDLALSVFVPTEWTCIKLEPYTFEIKPNIPAFLKARARPIREALYRDAKAVFDRMRTYFYAPSTSTIASPLVVAPKATVVITFVVITVKSIRKNSSGMFYRPWLKLLAENSSLI